MYKNCNFPQMFVGDTLCLWRTLNSASTQNRQGSCSMSRDSLALSRKHTSSSSFFKVKRDSASSWPNREKVNRHSYSDNQDNFQFTKEIFLFWSQDILVLKSSLYTPKLFELFNCSGIKKEFQTSTKSGKYFLHPLLCHLSWALQHYVPRLILGIKQH